MSRRRLSDDERTLWKGVTRSIKPLRVLAADEPEPASPQIAKAPAKPSARSRTVAALPVPQPVKPVSSPALAPLGRKLKKRVARGSHAIDGRLDLHGFTQSEAHHALLGFLRRCQADGASIVLVITGKGVRGGGADSERGVLKRQVPMWLRLPQFRSFIVGFESAGVGHGGEGALYVRLRRGRGE